MRGDETRREEMRGDETSMRGGEALSSVMVTIHPHIVS
jgi:hypothetical protein